MRGKEMRLLDGTLYHRITPAYAGKSWRTVRSTWCGKDHPRLCGEKVTEAETVTKEDRITPAYAGKSSAFIRSSPVNQDHPRLCGEKK